jgi:hypothetical protein
MKPVSAIAAPRMIVSESSPADEPLGWEALATHPVRAIADKVATPRAATVRDENLMVRLLTFFRVLLWTGKQDQMCTPAA